MSKTKVKVSFHKCIQDSQEYGSADEHMVSRLFFSIDAGGRRHDGLHMDIKQSVGADFESGPLEVGPPEGYNGPMNYQEFRKGCERYYRMCVGSQGHGIRIAGGRDIRMMNNTFVIPWSFEFEAEEQRAPW